MCGILQILQKFTDFLPMSQIEGFIRCVLNKIILFKNSLPQWGFGGKAPDLLPRKGLRFFFLLVRFLFFLRPKRKKMNKAESSE